MSSLPNDTHPTGPMTTRHVALLGDSTLDNRAYTEGGPDVVAHMNRLLGERGHATLLARDGALISDIPRQLAGVREAMSGDTRFTHVVLSVGGNDLLAQIDVFEQPASTVGEALLEVRARAVRFGATYREALDEVLRVRLPTVACTVYAGAFDDPTEAAVIEAGLRIFDHEIISAAQDRAVPIVDLRRVCNAPEHYWNPIEPGARGGARIAAALVEALARG